MGDRENLEDAERTEFAPELHPPNSEPPADEDQDRTVVEHANDSTDVIETIHDPAPPDKPSEDIFSAHTLNHEEAESPGRNDQDRTTLSEPSADQTAVVETIIDSEPPSDDSEDTFTAQTVIDEVEESATPTLVDGRTFPTADVPATPSSMTGRGLGLAGAGSDSPTMDTSAQTADQSHVGDTVRKLGRFEIRSTLGEGSFGTVYLAHDPDLDRPVAIKVARTGILSTSQDVDRFVREARAAAQLRHPRIVPVYEVGQIGASSYLVYEFIDGMTLKQQLAERKQLAPEEAVEVVTQLADALDYAHDCGVVHRDMKPDNVLLDQDGHPHIADFGLARRADGDATRTREGTLMGTPAYMSPEQADGKAHAADGRTDIWSVGIILYELLTGSRPFQGNITETLVQVKEAEVRSPRKLDRSIPRDLETICLKCLVREPEQRFSYGRELAEELRRWTRGEPIVSRRINPITRVWRWAKRNRTDAALVATIFLVMAVGTVVSLMFASEANENAHRLVEQQVKRALDRIDDLQSAKSDEVPLVIEELKLVIQELKEDARASVLPRLREEESRLGKDPKDSANYVRVRMALLWLEEPGDNRDRLIDEAFHRHLLFAESGEFLMIRTMLDQFSDPFLNDLWDTAIDSSVDVNQRFRAFCALALYDDTSDLWPGVAVDVTDILLGRNTLELPDWLEALRPIRDHLLTHLRRTFDGGSDRIRLQSAAAMDDLFGDNSRVLVELVQKAEPAQLASLLPRLHPDSHTIASLLRRRLAEPTPDKASSSKQEEDAAERANCVIGLIELDALDSDVTWLTQEKSPRVRSYVIRRAGAARVAPGPLLTLINEDIPPSAYAAIVLALGEYDEDVVTLTRREKLAEVLSAHFTSLEDSGSHLALRWLMRKWGYVKRVADIEDSLKGRSPKHGQRWRVNSLGQTMVIIHPKGPFRMGAGPDELGAYGPEPAHRRLIPRSFEISACEITVSEFRSFSPKHTIDNQASRSDNCPVNNVTWFHVAQFCRLLSEQEDVSADQICYQPPEGILGRVAPYPDALDRTGYRLPTAAEWEYACRAGSDLSRFFGDSNDLLSDYAWYNLNSDAQSHTVGTLRPNPYGLFDVYGNNAEWCHNLYFPDLPQNGLGANDVYVDGPDTRTGFYRAVRGGDFEDMNVRLRSAFREPGISPDHLYNGLGFRIARTLETSRDSQIP